MSRCCVIIFILGVVFLLETSCSSQKNLAKVKESDIIVFSEKNDDNSTLAKEVDSWLGVPYKYGGQSKTGVDCSGLVVEIYKTVYIKKLYRS